MAAFGMQASYYDGNAGLYADPAVRPLYPPELYDRIYAFAGPACDAALDVATGSGQCARQLAQRYRQARPGRPARAQRPAEAVAQRHTRAQVWAIDASAEQLKRCAAHERVVFKKGVAEDTGLPAGSVDLVTAAAALHWCGARGAGPFVKARRAHARAARRFDVPAYYREARRVLRPGGALAAFTYYIPDIEGSAAANALLGRLWHERLGPKAEAHLLVERQYAGLEPGARDFGVVERAAVAFEHRSTVRNLVRARARPQAARLGAAGAAYLTASSAQVLLLRTSGLYGKFVAEGPDRPDPLVPFEAELLAALGAADAGHPLTLRYTVCLILARDPRPLS